MSFFQPESVHCRRALLADGWSDEVRIRIRDGAVESVEAGVERRADLLLDTVVPGLSNAHSHAHQRAMAGRAEFRRGDDDFWSWRHIMYSNLERIGPEELELIAAMLYLEMVSHGYTSVGEFQYLHHDLNGASYANPAELTLRTITAAQRVGISITALPVFYRYGGFGEAEPADGQRRFVNSAQQFFEIVEELERYAAAHHDVLVGVAPHSLRAVNGQALHEFLNGLNSCSEDMPVHVHIAEQQKEIEECQRYNGARPVAWLYDQVDVNPRWCLVHATHVDPTEVRAMIDSGAVVCLCPTTEANLGDGIFPALDFLEGGGRICIGSDSHISISPVEELRWLEYVQRLITTSRTVLASDHCSSNGRRLFEAALAGGHQALGLAVPGIAAGARADLVELDSDHPRLCGLENDSILDGWLFSGNENPVRNVLAQGRHVVVDGRSGESESIKTAFRKLMSSL